MERIFFINLGMEADFVMELMLELAFIEKDF
jgi:hypothetical protein